MTGLSWLDLAREHRTSLLLALRVMSATPKEELDVSVLTEFAAARRLLWLGIAAAFAPRIGFAQAAPHPQRRWYERAERMRQHAMATGDQAYGAVLVAGNGVVAEGPSRVVIESDPDAHAERVAIREARRILGTENLTGAVLYSTSRPCRLCEQAAARAGVARMYFGPELLDAGVPRL